MWNIMLSSSTAVILRFVLTTTLIFVNVSYGQNSQEIRRRFEYKLSFKGPYLVVRDGTVPFWDHFGHAIASDESIRITPSLKSKKGSVWSKETNPNEHWEVEVIFRINGRGRIGADGLAIWYTSQRGEEGPVFGSNDKWTGLGIFFDSFDNDAQHNNPYIMAMNNDGTQIYDHEGDGLSQQLGGCLRDFRNKPFPVRVKIEYYKKTLTILFHNGLTNNHDEFEMCMRVEGVDLPLNGYFGISAATGGLADDHDVLAFITHSLLPPAETLNAGQELPDAERQKFEKEYEDYREKLEKAKEEYKKEHPEKQAGMEMDEDKLYEAQELREFKMIFDGQNEIHRLVRTLVTKLDEVIGRQEKQLSMLSLINQGSQTVHSQQQQINSVPIERHEVEGILSAQKDLASNIKDLRSLLSDVQSRVASLGSGGSGGEISKHWQDIQTYISNMHSDVRTLLALPKSTEQSSCVTSTYLLFFLSIQLVCIIGFMMYKSSKELAAKKFY